MIGTLDIEIYGKLGLQEDVMIKVLAEVWIHSNAETGEPCEGSLLND